MSTPSTKAATKKLQAAILTPVFLGVAPIFGKMALRGGADPFSVAAFRSVMVAAILWFFYLLFWRQYIFIYPAGLIACIAIGFTNGIGSLFYYSGLGLLDASVAQILNATYVIFVVVLTRIEGTHIGILVVFRVCVALVGVLFITGGITGEATWLGIGLMLANALLFGGTVVMSQRVLYEMPPQTVTLYIMSAMAVIVVIARAASSQTLSDVKGEAFLPIFLLAISTGLSRLLLFASVKGVGSLRTALSAVAESAVAVSLAFLFLDESLTDIQWLGVGILSVSLFMPTERSVLAEVATIPSRLPNLSGMWFQRMASSDGKLSTQELREIMQAEEMPNKFNTQERQSIGNLLGEEVLQKILEIQQETDQEQKD